MSLLPIDDYMRRSTGFDIHTRDELKEYQLKKLNETLKKVHSGYYSFLPEHINSLEDMRQLPFTTQEELTQNHRQMLISSSSEVARIISGNTSGTTGSPKKIYYTKEDIDDLLDFFECGFCELIEEGSKAMITMPFTGENGLGELIDTSIRRFGAATLCVGAGNTYSYLDRVMEKECPDVYVGTPCSLLSLARACPHLSIKRACISADTVPPNVYRILSEVYGIELFITYGSRELCLGGAETCSAHNGMHMRENHFIAEIIDEKGNVLPDGYEGELVITGIGMHALPLIRYRTGDITRIIPGKCSCGSITRRMEPTNRILEGMDIASFDDEVFTVPQVIDYSLSMINGALVFDVLLKERTAPSVIEDSIAHVAEGMEVSIKTSLFSEESKGYYPVKRRIV